MEQGIAVLLVACALIYVIARISKAARASACSCSAGCCGCAGACQCEEQENHGVNGKQRHLKDEKGNA